MANTLPLLPNVNYLVPRIWATRFWLNDPSTWPGPPAGAIRLSELAVSLAAVELLAANLFDSRARKHWSDRLCDINGVWAVVDEASDFVHFARQGVEVIPRFLLPASREELILRLEQGDGEFAVECKSIRPGTGRKIKAEHFKRFADIVLAYLARSDLRRSVRIAVDGNLEESDLGVLFRHVHDRVVRRRSGLMQFELSGRPVTIELSPIPTTIVTEQTMGRVAADYDYHLVLIATEPNLNGDQQIRGVIGYDTSPTGRPWRSLRDAIDAAAVQLEGRGPGLASVDFFDYVENLESRGPGPFSIVDVMIEKVGRLPQLAGVMVSCDPDLQLANAPRQGWAHIFALRDRLPVDLPIGHQLDLTGKTGLPSASALVSELRTADVQMMSAQGADPLLVEST